MIITLKIVGWTLRASALICITYIVAGVLQGTIVTIPALLSSIAYHAAFATGGVLALYQARKIKSSRAEQPASA